jgi:hypothetical protein
MRVPVQFNAFGRLVFTPRSPVGASGSILVASLLVLSSALLLTTGVSTALGLPRLLSRGLRLTLRLAGLLTGTAATATTPTATTGRPAFSLSSLLRL